MDSVPEMDESAALVSVWGDSMLIAGPAMLLIDHDFRIVETGSVLAASASGLIPGTDVAQFFQVLHPTDASLDPESVMRGKYTGCPFYLGIPGSSVVLRGVFCGIPGPRQFLLFHGDVGCGSFVQSALPVTATKSDTEGSSATSDWTTGQVPLADDEPAAEGGWLPQLQYSGPRGPRDRTINVDDDLISSGAEQTFHSTDSILPAEDGLAALAPRAARHSGSASVSRLSATRLSMGRTTSGVRIPLRTVVPHDQCGGDWDFWWEILEGLPTLLANRTQDMRDALETRNMKALHLAAHALKGAAESCCAPKLTNLCYDLEAYAMNFTVGRLTKTVVDEDDFQAAVEHFCPSIFNETKTLTSIIYFIASLSCDERRSLLDEVAGFPELVAETETMAAYVHSESDSDTWLPAPIAAGDFEAAVLAFAAESDRNQSDQSIAAPVPPPPGAPAASTDTAGDPGATVAADSASGSTASGTRASATATGGGLEAAVEVAAFEPAVVPAIALAFALLDKDSGPFTRRLSSSLRPSEDGAVAAADLAAAAEDLARLQLMDVEAKLNLGLERRSLDISRPVTAVASLPSAAVSGTLPTVPETEAATANWLKLYGESPAGTAAAEAAAAASDDAAAAATAATWTRSSAARQMSLARSSSSDAISSPWGGDPATSAAAGALPGAAEGEGSSAQEDAGVVVHGAAAITHAQARKRSSDTTSGRRPSSFERKRQMGRSAELSTLSTLAERMRSRVSVSPSETGDETLMIVDDNPMVRMILRRGLTAVGYRVVVTDSVESALEYLTNPVSILPSVLVAGLFFKPLQMTGIQLCMRLRGCGLSKLLLPIILMTARMTKELMDEGIAAGANDFMSKPVTVRDVLARTREQMQAVKAISVEAEARMLRQFLPAAVIRKLKSGASLPFTEPAPNVTFMFADIVGFTTMCSSLPAERVVGMLHDLFSAFDDALGPLGVFKVDTIGDAYIATTGCALTEDTHLENPATRMLEFAAEIISITKNLQPVEGWDHPIRIRVGVHTGPAIASAMGRTSYKFTFIGDTVNIASRMESHGHPMCVHCSATFVEALINEGAEDTDFLPRRGVMIKGKGIMQTSIAKVGGWREFEELQMMEKQTNAKRRQTFT